MTGAALFVITGLLWTIHSLIVVADGASRDPPPVGDWSRVLLFSAAIASFALAIRAFARMVGGRVATRVAYAVTAGALLASVANVFEDGFGVDAAFWPFVVGTVVIVPGLALLTTLVAFRGRSRVLAVVPGACLLDILFLHPVGGGVLTLLAWLFAAAESIRRTRPIVTAQPSDME